MIETLEDIAMDDKQRQSISQRLQALARDLSDHPEINILRVIQLKEAIRNGSYHIHSSAIALKLCNELQG